MKKLPLNKAMIFLGGAVILVITSSSFLVRSGFFKDAEYCRFDDGKQAEAVALSIVKNRADLAGESIENNLSARVERFWTSKGENLAVINVLGQEGQIVARVTLSESYCDLILELPNAGEP